MKRKLLILCCVFILMTSCALIVSADPPDRKTNNEDTKNNASEAESTDATTESTSTINIDKLQENKPLVAIVLVVLVVLLFLSIRSLISYSKEEPQIASQMNPSIPQKRTLTISVLDEQKKPVENAIVSLKSMYGFSIQHSNRTGGDGRAVFSSIGSEIKQVEVTKMNFEKQNHSIESNQERVEITLEKNKIILLKIMDEDEEPLCDIPVIIKDKQVFTQERVSKSDGIVKFIGLKHGEYQVSIEHQEYLPVKMSIPATDEGKGYYPIKLTKQAGSLDVILNIQISGIKVIAKNIRSNSEVFRESDSSGIVHFGKIPIGNYQISLQYDSLLKSDSYKCTIELNKKHTIELKIDYNYKLSSENLIKMQQIKEIIDISYQEVSSYDTCIQQYLKRIGEMPVELCENVSNKQFYFINSDLTPADFFRHIIDTAELLANGIAAIIRAKTNIDLYAEAKGLPQLEHITLSEYPDSKLREFIQESAKYYATHHVEVENYLSSIDQEITQKSGDLTVYPIADMWSLCKDLLTRCDNETDPKKQGVMLFLLEQTLINLQEMFHNDDVIKRLKLRIF